MNFTIGNMESKKIVKGIFITGLIYFIIAIIEVLTQFIIMPRTDGSSISVKLNMYIAIVRIFMTPIILLILFKLCCEALYKIIKAAQIIIESNTHK